MSEDTLDNETWEDRSKDDMAYDEIIAREDNDEHENELLNENEDTNQEYANNDEDEENFNHHQGGGDFNNSGDLEQEERGDDNDRASGDNDGEGEKEEENEFVVWADDADENGDDDKRSHKTSSNQPESDVKFSVDMVKDRDQISLIWNGEKILVPCKEEILRDFKLFSRQLNIIAYPMLIDDIYSDALSPFIKSAVNVSMEMDETSDGLPIKGYLRMKFLTLAEVKSAMEMLKSLSNESRTISVHHFAENDSEGHILSKVKGKMTTKDSLPERFLFVSNFGNVAGGEEGNDGSSGGESNTITETDLKNIFSESTRIILPTKDERNLGYAYVEYGTDESINEALEKYRDISLNDRPLFVIRALNEKKEATGLLKDSLRLYWLDQVKSLDTIDREKKSAKEISEIEQKLHRYKKRIVTDNIKRQELGIPIPPEEQFQLDPEREEKDREREKERASKRSSSRKRSPLRTRKFSPPPRRSRGSYRGGPSNYGGPMRRGGGNSDELVNQLQHLVGVLSNKLPVEPNRYDYHERDVRHSSYMDSRSRDRYPGDFSDSRRGYDNKRMAPDDYDRDRKRRYDDMDYMRYDRGPDYRNYRGGPRW